jgi:hypothetical protein
MPINDDFRTKKGLNAGIETSSLMPNYTIDATSIG